MRVDRVFIKKTRQFLPSIDRLLSPQLHHAPLAANKDKGFSVTPILGQLSSARGLSDTLATGVLLAACFVFFMIVRLRIQYIAFPDENFDYMEQAYRLVHGYGTPAWTYELGIRSWIFPGLLAVAMWIGSWFGDASVERLFAHGLIAMTTLIPIWCAIAWSRWIGLGPLALIAGIVVATWFEMSFWSTVPLGEVFAGNLFCLSLHRAFVFARSGRWQNLVVLGLLIGFVFAIRFQFAVFLFVLSVLACGVHWRRWLVLTASAAGVLILAGILDWLTLGLPFQSIWLNAWVNAAVPISEYGMAKMPFYYLTDVERTYWSAAALLLVGLALSGMRYYPVLGILVTVIWAFHSLLSNQQTRFLYPAIALLAIAAGIGFAAIIRTLDARWPRIWTWVASGALFALWVSASADRALAGPFARNWQHRSGYLALADYVRRHDDICGLSMLPGTASVFGHSFIGRNIPLYIHAPALAFEAVTPYSNAVATIESMPPPAGYDTVACWSDGYRDFFGTIPNDRVCLHQRRGMCAEGAPPDRDVWPPSALQFERFANKVPPP